MRLNKTVLALGIMTVGALVLIGSCGKAYADSSEPIDLKPVTTVTAEAEKDPRPVIVTERNPDTKDVEKLARLLWSSPLRAECYKKELVYVVLNRAAYGDPFGDSIQECVNSREFAFYDAHAHRSEENIRIVREAINEWHSRKDGNNPGTVIRLDAYYISFYGENNRRMEILDINRNPIPWDPVK